MFSDIKNHWAESCIDQLAARSLVSGYPDGSFQPNGFLTRAEFAALMCRAFPDAAIVQNAAAFKDVPQNYWAYEVIQTASKKRFFSGYPDQTFRPEQPLPRVQAIIVLAAILDIDNPPAPLPILQQCFEDAAEIPSYAQKGIAAAAQNALIVNDPLLKKLRPNQRATRGEIAALLCRALKINAVLEASIVLKIPALNQSRAVFNQTPKTLASFLGWPLEESTQGENQFTATYVSKGMKQLCFPNFTGQLTLTVKFVNNQAQMVLIDPVGEQNITADLKKIFEYLFGYQSPTWKTLKVEGGHEGFVVQEACLGDGVAMSWTESNQGTTNIRVYYKSVCEPPYE